MKKLDNVTQVTTDMDAHTLTVSFDDEKLDLANVIGALEDAGYVARNPTKVQ
jgi:copper chaperone CopZ